MDKRRPPLRRRLFLRRKNINEQTIPFITMKFLSDKQEETTDKDEFHKKYGFLFRDYELLSNIIQKYENNDNTYISDLKSSIIALKNSQNKYIKQVFSSIQEDKFKKEFLEEVLDIINNDLNLFNIAIRNKYIQSRIDSVSLLLTHDQLLADLATVNHEITNIYDPTCKEGLIISLLNNFEKAVLYEKDETSYLQAIQNFIINEMPLEKIDIQNKDVLLDKDDTKYDTIISIPGPFSAQRTLIESYDKKFDKYATRNPNSLHLLNLINHLDDNGLLITTTTQDILVRKDALELRKCLVENNLLDAVIECQVGFRSEEMILIINKNKKTEDVLFIKQNSYYEIEDEDIDEKIIECYKNREIIKQFSNIVSKDEIIENEYKIIPKRYVYTLNYEIRNINDVKEEQDKYTEQIRELDEQINQLLDDINE